MKKTAYNKPELNVYQIRSLHLLSMSVEGGEIKSVSIYDEEEEYEAEELEII